MACLGPVMCCILLMSFSLFFVCPNVCEEEDITRSVYVCLSSESLCVNTMHLKVTLAGKYLLVGNKLRLVLHPFELLHKTSMYSYV